MILDMNIKLTQLNKEIITNCLMTNTIVTSDDIFVHVQAQLKNRRCEISFIKFSTIVIYIHILLNIDLPPGRIDDFTDYCERPFKNLPNYKLKECQ